MNQKPPHNPNLTDRQKSIAFDEATEPPFSHPLNDEKRAGAYRCAVCSADLFRSEDKFESGCGWPSFTRPVDAAALGEKIDHKIGAARTEVHCATCGAHMGHVFPDGPAPTGLRYCVNGSVLAFDAAESDQ